MRFSLLCSLSCYKLYSYFIRLIAWRKAVNNRGSRVKNNQYMSQICKIIIRIIMVDPIEAISYFWLYAPFLLVSLRF